jgi:hypothetical protein
MYVDNYVHFRVVYRTSKMHQMLHDGPVTHLRERFILFMLIYLPCSIYSLLYNSEVLIFRLSLCFQYLLYLLFLKCTKQIYKSKSVNCVWACEPPMMAYRKWRSGVHNNIKNRFKIFTFPVHWAL